MFRKGLVISTVLVLTATALTFADAAAEEQKTGTPWWNIPSGEMVTKQVPVLPKEADSFENTSVLVEGFVVEVSTEALTEAGVHPIGQAPEGVSILKILSCLDDPDNAEVVSGVKVTARNGKEASLQNTKSIYVKTERGNTVSYNNFDSGKTFTAFVRLSSEDAIFVEYSFAMSSFEENEDKTSPPTTFSNNWTGAMTMSTGKPMIASAVQDDESVTFLILTATIQE